MVVEVAMVDPPGFESILPRLRQAKTTAPGCDPRSTLRRRRGDYLAEAPRRHPRRHPGDDQGERPAEVARLGRVPFSRPSAARPSRQAPGSALMVTGALGPRPRRPIAVSDHARTDSKAAVGHNVMRPRPAATRQGPLGPSADSGRRRNRRQGPRPPPGRDPRRHLIGRGAVLTGGRRMALVDPEWLR